MPGSPHFSILQATESWAGPGNKAFMLKCIYNLASLVTSVKYTALYHPQACMFVNISPLESNVPETVSTLEFGQNARQVELGKATKHVTRHAV